MVLQKLEEARQQKVSVLSPAFRWAQSLDSVFLEVKWATRFDSPACLDTFEHSQRLEGTSLVVECDCRNDRTILHYKLDLDLLHEAA